MAETAHLAWYRQGTVSVTDGSSTVTGHGTNFLSAGINQGAAFRIDNRFYAWEIKRVVSDTELELATPYYGGTVSNASYSIDRNHQSTLPADLAARLAKSMGNWEKRYNLDMQTITGKSAYDVAVENGFVGTESEWLESLKAAGEWTTLNNRTNILTYNNWGAHNSIYRGKNLGTAITAAQIQAIRYKTFADLYVGDYWTLPIDGTTYARIMQCSGVPNCPQGAAVVFLDNSKWKFSFNDTNTIEGHLYNSKMYTEHLPYILSKVKEVIPDEYIYKYESIGVADAVNSSSEVSHRITVENLQIFLPTFAQITGGNTFAKHAAYSNFSHYQKWPYYVHNPIGATYNQFWLDSTYNNGWMFTIATEDNYWYLPATQTRNTSPYILLG